MEIIMVNGKLQQILSSSTDIRKIQVKYPKIYSNQVGFVVDVAFDKQTRSNIFLSIMQNPKPGVDKFFLIRTFLFDLRGTHELLCKDIDTNIVYTIGADYTIDGNTLTLVLLR